MKVSSMVESAYSVGLMIFKAENMGLGETCTHKGDDTGV